ncbi:MULTISPECIES: SixA phosphatase family protein [Nocardioides]|uniref:SixA phosphatase family protein n=1 Tax=Nocardioides vastitatis TaxID=2568655 RepID=A0ABW0ZFV4_9ACTN|nr:histidine phosphatase family protein [Nocardioides sp.]THJ03910.1 histidine phosphatase family protein [Nocardioides sp.]
MDSNRQVVVVRHAKAEAFAPNDVDRVLADSGRADARALGRWFREQGIDADAAYVSYAARTRETWALVAEAARWEVEPEIDGGLYGTDEDGVLELLRETDDSARTAVVVGHNPAIGLLAQLLDDGDGGAAGTDLAGFPTCTAAVFEVTCSWADVAPMCARLRAFHVARA